MCEPAQGRRSMAAFAWQSLLSMALHLLCQGKRRPRGCNGGYNRVQIWAGKAGLQQNWSWCLTGYGASNVFLLRSLLGWLSLHCALFCGWIAVVHPRQALSLQNDGQICQTWVPVLPDNTLLFGWEIFASSFECCPAPHSSST